MKKKKNSIIAVMIFIGLVGIGVTLIVAKNMSSRKDELALERYHEMREQRPQDNHESIVEQSDVEHVRIKEKTDTIYLQPNYRYTYYLEGSVTIVTEYNGVVYNPRINTSGNDYSFQWIVNGETIPAYLGKQALSKETKVFTLEITPDHIPRDVEIWIENK